MALLWVMLLELLTWLLAGAVVLGLGVAAWRLLGLATVDDADNGVEPGDAGSKSRNEFGQGAGGSPFALPPAHASAAVLPPASVAARVWRAWWLGLAALVGVLQAWHLALPINAWCMLAVAGLGGAGCWWCRRELAAAWDEVITTPDARRLLIVWGVVGVWLANRAAGSAHGAATGLVWYPIVSWYDAYPAVPGVGNVHPAYGYNSGWLLVSAWLSEGPWRGRVGHVTNGWVLWWLSAAAVWGVGEVLKVRGPKFEGQSQHERPAVTDHPVAADARLRASDFVLRTSSPHAVFHAALAVPVVVLALGAGVVEPWAAVASTALILVATGCVLGVVGPDELHRGRRIDTLIVASLLAVTAVVVDPLVWPGGAALLGVAGWRLMKTERAWVEGRRPTRSVGVGHEQLPGMAPRSASVAALGMAAGCLLLLWTTRNVILTGYLLYPVTKIGLPLDWAVPGTLASWSAWLPRAQPGALLTGGLGAVVLPGIIGIGGLFAWMARGGTEGRWKSAAAPGAAMAVGVIGWAVFAGRGMSGAGPAWALVALTAALHARTISKRGRPSRGPSGRQLVTTFAVAAVVAGGLGAALGGGRSLWPVSQRFVGGGASDRVSAARSPGVLTDDGASSGWTGVPVRWPWSSDVGLSPRANPERYVWVSRWGVEVTLTDGGTAWLDRNAETAESDEADGRLVGLGDPPAVAWISDPDDPSSPSRPEDPPSTPAGHRWPWAVAQPSVPSPPSVHLRYRGGEAGGVRRGFVIDRRGAGSLLDPAQPRNIRQADRTDEVFRDG